MKLVLTLLLFLFLPCFVRGEGEESVGNAPVTAQPEWSPGVVNVVNLKSRIYRNWVNGNENFFFKGKASEVNEALAKYAEIKQTVREVILLPGNGMTQRFSGEKIDYDWKVHVPSGIYRAITKQKDATFTLYINRAIGTPPKDRQRLDDWIRQLDHNEFTVREKARKELAKYGNELKPILKEVLKKGQARAEGQRQIELLLAAMEGIDVESLDIPKDVRLVEVDDLIAINLKKLESPDARTRSFAVQELASLACYSEKMVPVLVETMKKDKDAHVRRCIAGGFSQMGSRASPAAEVIETCLKDPDEYIRDACKRAKEAIANDKEDHSAEQKRFQAILDDIHRLKMSREGK